MSKQLDKSHCSLMDHIFPTLASLLLALAEVIPWLNHIRIFLGVSLSSANHSQMYLTIQILSQELFWQSGQVEVWMLLGGSLSKWRYPRTHKHMNIMSREVQPLQSAPGGTRAPGFWFEMYYTRVYTKRLHHNHFGCIGSGGNLETEALILSYLTDWLIKMV